MPAGMTWDDILRAVEAGALVVTTLISVGTYLRAGRAERHTRHTASKMTEVVENVQKVELATNSMMEAARKLALEKAEADSDRARAAGLAEGLGRKA